MLYLPKVKELWLKEPKLLKHNFSLQSFYVAFFPTQDKNRPKADIFPSWFINFGQQKSCAPIKIFIT